MSGWPRDPHPTFWCYLLTGICEESDARCINASAQSEGYHLAAARADMDAVCVIVAATNVKSPAQRKAIVQKTIKQFLTAGRLGTKETFATFAKYATEGIPAEREFEAVKTCTSLKSDKRPGTSTFQIAN